MQERGELRALKREIKMSKERKVKKKTMCMEMKERKKRKEEKERKRNGKKDMKRDESSER
jgi:hypothetical protein